MKKNKAAQELAALAHKSPKWIKAMKNAAEARGFEATNKSDYFAALGALGRKSPSWKENVVKAARKSTTWKHNFKKRWERGKSLQSQPKDV